MKHQYHELSYQLVRLVSSPDEWQILLKVDEAQTINVCKSIFMFFKINVENRDPPGSIQVKYGPDQLFLDYNKSFKLPNAAARLIDLKVCYSSFHQEPIPEKCQKVHTNPRMVSLLPAPQSDKYTNPFVYLSLFSESGCDIEVTIKFKNSHEQLKRKTVCKLDQTEMD